MYKHDPNDPEQAKRSLNGKLGMIARVTAYEILKLPHICETCGKEGKTEVHHINKDRENNTRENIKILCRACHNAVHGVILPKKEPIGVKGADRRFRPGATERKVSFLEIRRLATERYKKKWGIKP